MYHIFSIKLEKYLLKFNSHFLCNKIMAINLIEQNIKVKETSFQPYGT